MAAAGALRQLPKHRAPPRLAIPTQGESEMGDKKGGGKPVDKGGKPVDKGGDKGKPVDKGGKK